MSVPASAEDAARSIFRAHGAEVDPPGRERDADRDEKDEGGGEGDDGWRRRTDFMEGRIESVTEMKRRVP